MTEFNDGYQAAARDIKSWLMGRYPDSNATANTIVVHLDAIAPPQPEPVVEELCADCGNPLRIDAHVYPWVYGHHPFHRQRPVEASRIPVETALCWMCGGHQWIDKRETDENPWWSAATGGERGQRWPVYSLHAAPGVFSGELIACPFCKPVTPSPEAVEPPLTPCDRTHIPDVPCRKCGATEDWAVESSQEGSETGGEWTRLEPIDGVAKWRNLATGKFGYLYIDLEAAIARDAEERARAAELDRDRAVGAWVTCDRMRAAAEERATQAEGQREAFRWALQAITTGGTESRRPLTAEGYENIISAFRETARRALSPSTEAQDSPTEDK